MTLAEKYGIQSNTKVEEINLNQNPYKYEGTFKEFYGLVASGKVKTLKQNGIICGISVGGYDTIEADNLAGKAFAEAYEPYQTMIYMDLATQLIEANLIPNIISEHPLRVTILNGLVTLNEYGEEINLKEEKEPDNATGRPTFKVGGVEYTIIENPNISAPGHHPMIARVDGQAIPNRKEIARQFLRGYGYTDEDFAYPVNTEDLERKVERILGE